MKLEKYKETDWKRCPGLIVGRDEKTNKIVYIPSARDGRNYFVFGRPGDGKTQMLILTAVMWGKHSFKPKVKTSGSVFCIDLKGDIYKQTNPYRKIRCFSLINPEKSCSFNPFDGVENMNDDDLFAHIKSLGINIIPKPRGNETSYFYDTALQFWIAICLHMLSEDINTSFPEVVFAIKNKTYKDWLDFILNGSCDAAKMQVAAKVDETEQNVASGYSTLATALDTFAQKKVMKLLGNNPKNKFVSEQALEDGYDVYLQLNTEQLKVYAPLISMITQKFMNEFALRENNPRAGRNKSGTLRPILMLLDEFPRLTTLDYDTVLTAFTTLRSMNISITAIMQSRSLLVDMLDENKANALADCIYGFFVLSMVDDKSKEWFSNLVGKKKELQWSNSLSEDSNEKKNAGRSVTEVEVPIYPPYLLDTLIDRDNNIDDLIVLINGKHARLNKMYFWKEVRKKAKR
ncbi:MAG: type IV secretory system conjugative DNA transfer family protein [Eubacterium sp.]|nr:type IV secretory system conjugative DNA transfer family protein [Eubacterium sp.]